MIAYAILLPYLLYISPEIGLRPNCTTEHCFAFNSGTPFFNRVFNTIRPDHAEIDTITSFFKTVPFAWFVDTDDTESQNALEEHKLYCDAVYTALTADLNMVPAFMYGDEIRIQAIDGNSSLLHEWVAINAPTFGVNAETLLEAITTLYKQVFPGALKLYIGYYKDKAVAAGMVFYHQQLISLHWVGTLAEWRNKGVGSALTYAVLRDAKQQGYKQAVLASADNALALYKRLGFRECSFYKIYRLTK